MKIKALLAGLALLASLPAQADVIGLGTFTSDHCTGGCGPQTGGFGGIAVTDHENGIIDINIVLNNGNTFANGGQAVVFGFNLVGNPTITYSNLSSNLFVIPNVIPVNQQAAGVLAADGLGNFEYGLEGNFNGPSALSTLSFTISGAGLTLASFAERSTTPPGDTPSFFGLDIFSGTTGRTGFVDLTNAGRPTPFDEPPNPVPVPGAVYLFASGLGGLWWLHKRRKKASTFETQAA